MMVETYEVAALTHERDSQEPLKEIDREQSPGTWPETTLNPGRAVDQFLWKGDPKATPIQRVGLFVFALMFLFLFVGFAVVMVVMLVRHEIYWQNILIVMMFITLSGIAGFRLLFNAFRHQKHHKGRR